MARKRRELKPEEAALWETVARSVKPLSGRRASEPETSGAEAGPARSPAHPPPPPAATKAGPPTETPTEISRKRPGAFDRRQYRRLARGRSAIDSTVDLHGMTQAAAHRRLIAHLSEAAGSGQRCVLVITGKGGRRHLQSAGVPAEFRRRRDFDQQAGVLRRAVPSWLETPPLADIVQSFAPAHIRHGGDGALYVMLRRGAGPP